MSKFLLRVLPEFRKLLRTEIERRGFAITKEKGSLLSAEACEGQGGHGLYFSRIAEEIYELVAEKMEVREWFVAFGLSG